MEHNYNDMDELFKQAFEKFEVAPPDELKRAIDAQIGKTNSPWRNFRFVFLLAFILIGLGIGFSVVFTSNSIATHQPSKQAPQLNAKQAVMDSTSNKTAKTTTESNHSQQNQALKLVHTTSPTLAHDIVKAQKRDKQNIQTKHNTQTNSLLLNPTHTNQSKIKQEQKFSSNSTDKIEEKSMETATNTNETTIADSVAITADATTAKSDSSTHSRETNDSKKSSYKHFLYAQINPYFALNSSKPEARYSEKNAFNFSLTYNHSFGKIGLESGIAFTRSLNEFLLQQSVKDSVYLNTTYDHIQIDTFEIVLDSNNQAIDTLFYSIIDSIPVDHYNVTSNQTNQSSNFVYTSWAIPLYFTYHLPINSHISLDILSGILTQYQKVKFTSTTSPLNKDIVYQRINFAFVFTPRVNYQFNRWGVFISTPMQYQMNPVQITNFSRKQLNMGLGFGVRVGV